jgi:hypothetical protein
MRNRANHKVVSNKSTGNLQIYPQHPANNELDTGWLAHICLNAHNFSSRYSCDLIMHRYCYISPNCRDH